MIGFKCFLRKNLEVRVLLLQRAGYLNVGKGSWENKDD
ncbi:hypothetical protein BAT_3864 [Bacillus pumilus ATCC 7061]|nr:hypothetical protein BAT_3864 [Bacillus pumilus ATCC 7061]